MNTCHSEYMRRHCNEAVLSSLSILMVEYSGIQYHFSTIRVPTAQPIFDPKGLSQLIAGLWNLEFKY